MLGGRVTAVGVAGNIFTLACGDGPDRDPGGLLRFGDAIETLADDVDEALLWDIREGGPTVKLRTEDTDEDVDFRRPSPERRR